MIAVDTQLVHKFKTLSGAEYAPKNDILYHKSLKLDRLNNSKSVARIDKMQMTERKRKNRKNDHAVLVN